MFINNIENNPAQKITKTLRNRRNLDKKDKNDLRKFIKNEEKNLLKNKKYNAKKLNIIEKVKKNKHNYNSYEIKNIIESNSLYDFNLVSGSKKKNIHNRDKQKKEKCIKTLYNKQPANKKFNNNFRSEEKHIRIASPSVKKYKPIPFSSYLNIATILVSI